MILNIWLNLNNVYIFCCHVPNYYRFSGSDNMFVILWFPWDRSSGTNQLGSLLKGFTGFSQKCQPGPWSYLSSRSSFKLMWLLGEFRSLELQGGDTCFLGVCEPWASTLNFQGSCSSLPHDSFHRLFSQCGSLLLQSEQGIIFLCFCQIVSYVQNHDIVTRVTSHCFCHIQLSIL